MPITFTLSGYFSSVSDVQLLNAQCPIYSVPFGMFIDTRAKQPSNAPNSMRLRVDGSETVFNDWKPLKALFAMISTPSGTLSEVMFSFVPLTSIK